MAIHEVADEVQHWARHLDAMEERAVYVGVDLEIELADCSAVQAYCMGAEHGLFRQELTFNGSEFRAVVNPRNLERIELLCRAFGRDITKSQRVSECWHELTVAEAEWHRQGKRPPSRGAIAAVA